LFGALRLQLELDAPIKRPVFGLLNSSTPSNVDYFPRFVRYFGGDPVFLGGFLQTFPSSMTTMKNTPIFKPIDFYEIFDLWQQLIRQMLTNYNNDLTSESQNTFCPLTQKQLLLLCAGVLRINFRDSQILTQSINPYGTTITANNWTTFLMANNCSASAIFDSVQLPLAFLENLRSLRMRAVFGAKFPRKIGGKVKMVTDKNNPQIILPVLGYFTSDTIPVYDYANNRLSTVVPILAPADPSEVLPQLHDGFAGTGTYVDLGTGDYLQNIVNIWNQFMGELSATVEAPGVLGHEMGILAFSQIAFTDYVVQVNGEDIDVNRFSKGLTAYDMVVQRKARREERLKREKSSIKKGKVIVKQLQAFTETNGIAATSASVPILGMVWPYVNFWIRPSIRLGYESSSDNQQPWSVTSGQLAMNEPYKINNTVVTGDTDTPIPSINQNVRNLQFVKMMLTGLKASGPNSYTQILLDAAAQGRGSGIMDVITAFASPLLSVLL